MQKDEELIEIELPLEEIGRLALEAHERDMTLNDYVVEILLREANKELEKTIEIELTEEEIGYLAIAAHNKNMTLNDFINALCLDYVQKKIDEYPEWEIGR